jgi:hypothetical protein
MYLRSDAQALASFRNRPFNRKRRTFSLRLKRPFAYRNLFAANVSFGENRAALSIAKTSPSQAVPHHIADVKVVIQKARLSMTDNRLACLEALPFE